MKVLILKTSSLGDLVHTLPALTDAGRALGDVTFDWVVEEGFSELPAWHALVDRVIPIALRRWRKSPLSTPHRREFSRFRARLRERQYDAVIDAQGLLLKSAVPGLMARGARYGYSWRSAREPLSCLAYNHRIRVSRKLHAIDRIRKLFAASLGYQHEQLPLDFGLEQPRSAAEKPYVVFLHGTTWASKHWPASYWAQLIDIAAGEQREVLLPWGNNVEHERAQALAAGHDSIRVLPRSGLTQLRDYLANAEGIVGLDSGLTHLAAALAVPTVTIYGSTAPGLTGTRGRYYDNRQVDYSCAPCLERQCRMSPEAIYPPCYQTLQPEQIWHGLTDLIKSKKQ